MNGQISEVAAQSDLDRKNTKNELRDIIARIAHTAGVDLSRSQADKIANRYKQGCELSEVLAFIQARAVTCPEPLAGAPRFKSRSVAEKPARSTTGKHHAG